MILGVDLDNTLVCYDGVFHAAAVAHGYMPIDGPKDKEGVRQYLCDQGREEDFTLLQGQVYGPDLVKAAPYPFSFETLRRAKDAGAILYLISHKTIHPCVGPSHDLRQAAREWLVRYGFLALFSSENVFFEPSQDDKAKRIASLGCTHFIDDMERLLRHPLLPSGLRRLWFHPLAKPDDSKAPGSLDCAASWLEVADWLRTTS